MMHLAGYKAVKPGIAGAYNRAVQVMDRTPYSHTELVFSDGVAGSASYMDKGVRLKSGIDFSDSSKWDLIPLPGHDEAFARQWFIERDFWKYDLLGQFRFFMPPLKDGVEKAWCSEADAAALQFPDPWRYSPAGLISAVRANPLLRNAA